MSFSAFVAEELKTRRVLVQHVETVHSSEATLDFLNSFVQPSSDSDSKFKASSKERRRSLQKEKKHDKLLSKAKQEQEDLAKSARFEQIWKRRRGDNEAVHDEALDEVCRVYDIRRIDVEETSRTVKQQDEISVEDQETLSKFLPLLRDCIPSAAEEIESDICSYALRQDSADEYVYDLYAVKENVDETEASYPFPLVQVDDDDGFYDGPDDSDYETDDSNAENNPLNDYPEEESTDDEEEGSGGSGSVSDEDGSETESDTRITSDDSERVDRSEDPLDEDENVNDESYHADYDDGEDWRWDYR